MSVKKEINVFMEGQKTEEHKYIKIPDASAVSQETSCTDTWDTKKLPLKSVKIIKKEKKTVKHIKSYVD